MRDRLIVSGLLLAACAGPSPDSSETSRTVVGDTTVVVAGAPVWGDRVALVEEAAIGELDGPEEYRFGDFIEIAVDESLGVYVFDGQDPALRYYDRDGRYVRTLGGQGEGPGEYEDVALGLAVRRSDGRLVMRDPRNGRINVYETGGAHSTSWPIASGLFTGDAFALDTADHMYSRILTATPEPDRVWPIALLHMDASGQIVDTIVPPPLAGEPEGYEGVFGPTKVWTLHPWGGLVVGVNDRFTFEHRRADGSLLRVRRDVPRAGFSSAERREREDVDAWRRRVLNDDPPPLPERKPAYRSIRVGDDGRIWVHRFVDAEQGEPIERTGVGGGEPPPAISWREPNTYDVFEPDGTFLGTIRLPPSTEVRIARGDYVWAVRRGAFNEPAVVRFRIEADG